MGVLSDRQIRDQVRITPFEDNRLKPVPGVISYGVSSYGYDLRLRPHFKIFTNVDTSIVDPKSFNPSCFTVREGESCLIPPNSFALTESVEVLEVPRDILCICLGKSTYARCGIIVNVTPLEPEWKGTVTIEISNTTPLPAKIYANEGICQVLFLRADEVCKVSYADKSGKYQDQRGATPPIVKT